MRPLRLAFGFFTILPFSRGGDIDEIARAGFLLPLVAVFLGGAEGLLGWGLGETFGPGLTAALVLATAVLLTGLHHADGLADVGDAVMAGGSHDRRLAVLKDRTMGIGALAALFFTYLISWAALAEALPAFRPGQLPWILISTEVSARLSLVLVAIMSPTSHKGSGSAFITALKGWRGAVAVFISVLSLAVMAWLLDEIRLPLASGGAAILTTTFLTVGGRRWFGGANGDLLGAAAESGRMTALLAAAAVAFQGLAGA